MSHVGPSISFKRRGCKALQCGTRLASVRKARLQSGQTKGLRTGGHVAVLLFLFTVAGADEVAAIGGLDVSESDDIIDLSESAAGGVWRGIGAGTSENWVEEATIG